MAEKQEYELNKLRKKWVGKKVICRVAEYGCALTPSAVIFGLNYEQWIGQNANRHSIGMGFAMLILSTIISLLEVTKSDSDFMKKFPKLVYIAFTLTIWAGTFALLASIMSELASMFFYVALGIWGAAIGEGVEKAYVNPRLALVEEARKKVGLSKQGEFAMQVEHASKEDQPRRAKEINSIINEKASRKQ